MTRNILSPKRNKENLPIYHCTACRKKIRTTYEAYIHPLLDCLVCRKCFNTYGTGDFANAWEDGVDDAGDDNYCRLCCDGGELFGCMRQDGEDRCHYSFCKDCITTNFPDDPVLNLKGEDDDLQWLCYACDKGRLAHLIEQAKFAMTELNEREQAKKLAATPKESTEKVGKIQTQSAENGKEKPTHANVPDKSKKDTQNLKTSDKFDKSEKPTKHSQMEQPKKVVRIDLSTIIEKKGKDNEGGDKNNQEEKSKADKTDVVDTSKLPKASAKDTCNKETRNDLSDTVEKKDHTETTKDVTQTEKTKKDKTIDDPKAESKSDKAEKCDKTKKKENDKNSKTNKTAKPDWTDAPPPDKPVKRTKTQHQSSSAIIVSSPHGNLPKSLKSARSSNSSKSGSSGSDIYRSQSLASQRSSSLGIKPAVERMKPTKEELELMLNSMEKTKESCMEEIKVKFGLILELVRMAHEDNSMRQSLLEMDLIDKPIADIKQMISKLRRLVSSF